ncbi:SIR2 family NAD-dependent protein deacylase [Parabacteroides sp. FAFU027]|uniref:SIR2 family NAD-dependent protein deacylase n=1 Tax=Parabacteroides sp. FAFU027 TaxID=2922715 RepID=UPI001FAE8D60|nr:NAD-dependent deacylase [Parabacteroides sp. FAFU027]
MKKLVVLSGAGMSKESGISTFREAGGLWDQYRIEEVATPEAWQRNPGLVLDFYNQRRVQLINSEPNDGHRGLAGLEKFFDVRIITQNIDNLHERAGSSHVLHLHGELMKVRSERYEELIYELSPENAEVHLGDTCEKGYQLRPHIVWFGEAVPMIEQAAKIAEEADIFVIIGTSMNVYPAAGLIHYVSRDVPVYLIDPNDVSVSGGYNVKVIRQGASEGVKILSEELIALS